VIAIFTYGEGLRLLAIPFASAVLGVVLASRPTPLVILIGSLFSVMTLFGVVGVSAVLVQHA
jgi:hypothetical protein